MSYVDEVLERVIAKNPAEPEFHLKLWQNAITSRSDLPLGSKSEPPLPPPIGSPVREFLNICSNPRNLILSFTRQ